MSTIFSKIQLITVGCLAATALTGAFNVPSASASGYNDASIHAQRGGDRFIDRDGDGRDDRFRDRDRDRDDDRIRDHRESRTCRYLRRRIEEARDRREYRLAARLEREYRRECSRHHRR
jgi:hypothetical protein